MHPINKQTTITEYNEFYNKMYKIYGIKFRIILHNLKFIINKKTQIEKQIYHLKYMIRAQLTPPTLKLINNFLSQNPNFNKKIKNLEMQITRSQLNKKIIELRKQKDEIYKIKNIIIKNYKESETIKIFKYINQYQLHLFKTNYNKISNKHQHQTKHKNKSPTHFMSTNRYQTTNTNLNSTNLSKYQIKKNIKLNTLYHKIPTILTNRSPNKKKQKNENKFIKNNHQNKTTPPKKLKAYVSSNLIKIKTSNIYYIKDIKNTDTKIQHSKPLQQLNQSKTQNSLSPKTKTHILNFHHKEKIKPIPFISTTHSNKNQETQHALPQHDLNYKPPLLIQDKPKNIIIDKTLNNKINITNLKLKNDNIPSPKLPTQITSNHISQTKTKEIHTDAYYDIIYQLPPPIQDSLKHMEKGNKIKNITQINDNQSITHNSQIPPAHLHLIKTNETLTLTTINEQKPMIMPNKDKQNIINPKQNKQQKINKQINKKLKTNYALLNKKMSQQNLDFIENNSQLAMDNYIIKLDTDLLNKNTPSHIDTNNELAQKILNYRNEHPNIKIIEQKIIHKLKNNKNKIYINLSDINIPIQIENILNKGLYYNLDNNTQNNKNKIRQLADIEYVFQKLVNYETQTNDTTNLNAEQKQQLLKIKNQIKNLEQIKINKDQISELDIMKQFLNQNKLTLTTADKSKTILILQVSDYIDLMEFSIFNNNFNTLDSDTNETDERRIQRLLREIYNQKLITKQIYTHLYPSGTSSPQIFGKLKIHKPIPIMRPIVNGCQSYYNNLAKWISNEIKKYIPKRYSIKNSLELKKLLIQLPITDKTIMFSLDAIDMYSNLSTQKIINFILYRYKIDNNKINPIPLYILSEMLQFCTTYITTQFNNKYYIQEGGVGMGNPLAPAFAEIGMYLLENRLVKAKKLNLLFFCHYADDMLLMANNPNSPQETLTYINKISKDLKFTLEIEEKQKINYLDVTITRNNNNLDFEVYNKPENNNLKINFNSHYPMHTKINNLKQEIKRVQIITTNPQTKKQQLNKISQIYQQNAYPKKIIENLFKKMEQEDIQTHHFTLQPNKNNIKDHTFKENINNAKENNDNINNNKKYISIRINNYNLVEQLNTQLKILKKSNLWTKINDLIINSAPPPGIIKQLINVGKPQLPKNTVQNIIYNSICICKSQNYIGTTERNFKQRMIQHLNTETSPIYQHNQLGNTHGFGHQPQQFNILFVERNPQIRLIIEKLCIQQLKPTLNRPNDGIKLTELP